MKTAGLGSEFCERGLTGSEALVALRILLLRALALAFGLALALAMILALTGIAAAEPPASGGLPPGGLPPGGVPPLLREVGFDPRLGGPVALDLKFRDENGRRVRLGDYAGNKPVILALVYYGCPMLCNQVVEALANSLRALSFEAGKQFEVVAVSFDPQESPAMARAKKQESLERYRLTQAEAGWHFLTGEESSIAALTEAAGFRYAQDPATKLFAHASGLLILTPEGKISRYLPGIEYAPRDLRLSLVEASANQIGTAADRLLLFCYQYDPATGKYGAAVMRLIRVGGVLTVLGLVAGMVLSWRRKKGSDE